MHDQRAAPASTNPEPERRRKLLLADDDATSRRVLGSILGAAGFEVWAVENGEEAWTAVESSPPDLIVLDFEMPVLDGAELCRRLRLSEREAIRQVPVIMLTGHAGEEDEIGCLAAGANDFVTKPVGREVLIARIETQLRLGALSDELRAQNTELARWRAAQEADLEAARTTQQAIISAPPPRVENWRTEALYLPFIQVGGDVYGWRRFGDGQWLFWLADATGHGVSAALFTTLAALLFQHAAAASSTAAEILSLVNSEFWSVFRGRSFMTACCVVTDRAGNVSFAGAGHPPLLVRRTTGEVESVSSQGTMLGVLPAMKIEQAELQLAPGEVVLLYTDGLFGLRKKQDKELRYTWQTVAKALGKAVPREGFLHEFASTLAGQARTETFDDDVAAIALEYAPTGGRV
jgi:sigma-B regulation protein RsbU (phosphoserine phosphatase)